MDLYAKSQGNFTYATDWSGFNIPGHVVKEFYAKYWHVTSEKTLNHKERALLKMLAPLIKSKKKFYVIGTFKDKKNKVGTTSIINHEIAHGLFYLNVEYKKQMTKLVSEFKSKKKFGVDLLKKGYSKPVIEDEIQAYLSTSSLSDLKKCFGCFLDPIIRVPKDFKETFTRFEESRK